VVLLHGNPTWGFLYRDVVASLIGSGRRVIVPYMIGCGQSKSLPGGVLLRANYVLPVGSNRFRISRRSGPGSSNENTMCRSSSGAGQVVAITCVPRRRTC
jgi:pimeloyl-ACP methyl ester carboxylesterase